MTALSRDRNADVLPEGVRVRASMPTPARRSRVAVATSLLVHAVLIALAVWATTEIAAPRGGAISDAFLRATGGGGGGGSGGSAFAITPPRTTAATPVEVPAVAVPATVVPPPPATPEPVPTFAQRDTAAGVLAAGVGGGSGGGQGSGVGPGSGSGTGPGSGGGSGGGVAVGREGSPPEPRQFIVPPLEYPKSLRGQTVAITFDVAADGRVTNIAVAPPISDRSFARKFDEVMRSYRFKPARNADGQPVPATIIVEVSFQGTS